MNERKRRSVTITLTEACNLDCTYCYENHKSQKRISMDTVKEIILKEMTEDNGFTEVEFDLFGGEPFLEFELIKEIEEYFHHIVSDKCSGKGHNSESTRQTSQKCFKSA